MSESLRAPFTLRSRVIARFAAPDQKEDPWSIVVAAHRTPRKLLEETLNLMEPSKVVGIVFNGDDRHVSRDSTSSKRTALRSKATRRHSDD